MKKDLDAMKAEKTRVEKVIENELKAFEENWEMKVDNVELLHLTSQGKPTYKITDVHLDVSVP